MCLVSRVSFIKFNENKNFNPWQYDRNASVKNVYSGGCGISQTELLKISIISL